MRNGSKSVVRAAALLLSLLTFIVYLPTLGNGFVNWDDNFYVYDNQNIRHMDLDFIMWSFSDASVGHWHPVTWFSLALDYALWGLNPWGFHLTNIILHSLNTFLVFILAMRLVEEGSSGQGAKGSSSDPRTLGPSAPIISVSIAAFLFGIHPVHVESVAWVTERKDVLSLLFFLMTLLSYIQYNVSKKRVYYGATLLLFAIALMTKPMVVTLPIVLLILDFYPFRRLAWKESKWVIIEKIPFFLLSLISSLITVWAAGSAGALENKFAFITRLFISARGCIFYIVKMIAPVNLAPLYPYPEKVNIFAFDYLGSALLLLSITIYCLWSLRRGRLIFAVWMYYIITLLPVIGIVHAGPQDTADRYTYMPSIGPFLLTGLAIGNIFERFSKRTIPITLLLLLLSGILIGKTVKQIGVWHDSITLWTHEIKLYPDIDTAYYNRGEAYSKLGNYRQALRDSDKAIELNPTYGDAYYNRGSVYYTLGDYQQAIKDLSIAIELKTRYYGKAYNNRGMAYQSIGKYPEAINDFNWGIGHNPQDEFAYSNRGNAYFRLEDHQRAISDYNKAIEINPQYVDAYNNRGYVYYILGNNEKSINDLNKAVKLDPGYAEAYYNLGLVYSKLGEDKEALTYYKKAADLGSRDAREYLDKHGR